MMDLTILLWIQTHLVVEWLSPLMIFLSYSWENGLLGILLSALLLFKKSTRFTGIVMLVAFLSCALVVNFAIKPLVARPRPFIAYPIDLLLKEPQGYSFPSGHASTVFSCVWAYFITQKNFWRWPLLLFALLVSFSRLYLFVHYPTDVLVGIVIGILFAYFSCALLNRFKEKPWLSRFLT